ncbi:MAG TPA: prephenate dehydratase [Candidatus Lokiarchaeia archaeon]|nr:prephenate dehydratase [Candidatus Lokiarchaeia archaeon]
MSEEDELIRLRRKINAIDDDIIAKLDERAAVAKDIGTLKQQMGLPIHDFSREREVINRLTSEDFQVVLPADIEKIYKEIMGACRHAEDLEEKVGFLGPEGSFAQIAAKDFFSEAGTVFMPFENSAQIFRALDAGSIEYGVTPIENSTQGTVPETLDLLLDSPSIKICGETEVKVHQNLIVNEGARDEDIATICSHPQGIAQARNFIHDRFPGAEIKEMNSTSTAVKFVKDSGINYAAIGSELAAEFYGLEILQRNIEDNPNNQTRFIIIGKAKMNATGQDRTSIIFAVKHEPGSLFHALEAFSKFQVNLTKIESRPARHLPDLWSYIFFTDFEGHLDDEPVQATLNELEQHTMFLKILGSYPRFTPKED